MGKAYIFITVLITVLLCQCTIKKKDTSVENNNETYYAVDSTDAGQINRKIAWEEANKYKASITDTTFLQTKEPMSDKAIDPFNPNYAFNQVVYLKALERAKKLLIVRDNQLFFDIKSGKDVLMSDDLFQYIVHVFENWNRGIKEKQYKIIKTNDGYDVEPIIQK